MAALAAGADGVHIEITRICQKGLSRRSRKSSCCLISIEALLRDLKRLAEAMSQNHRVDEPKRCGKKYVAGNWKMFTTAAAARSLARSVAEGAAALSQVKLGLFPPFPYLNTVVQAVAGSAIVVGAQDVYPEKERRVYR